MFEEPCTNVGKAADLPPESGPPPTDDEVDELSRRIGALHAEIRRAHLAMGEFQRTTGAVQVAQPGASTGPRADPSDLVARLGPATDHDHSSSDLYEAYTARGQARLARDEHDLA